MAEIDAWSKGLTLQQSDGEAWISLVAEVSTDVEAKHLKQPISVIDRDSSEKHNKMISPSKELLICYIMRKDQQGNSDERRQKEPLSYYMSGGN